MWYFQSRLRSNNPRSGIYEAGCHRGYQRLALSSTHSQPPRLLSTTLLCLWHDGVGFVGKCSLKFLRVDSLLGFVSMAMIYWTETDEERWSKRRSR